jgi:hypothetical protein
MATIRSLAATGHPRHEASFTTTAKGERLASLIAAFCIFSLRVFWVTMMNRSVSDASPALAFTALEIHLLAQLPKARRRRGEIPARFPTAHEIVENGEVRGRATISDGISTKSLLLPKKKDPVGRQRTRADFLKKRFCPNRKSHSDPSKRPVHASGQIRQFMISSGGTGGG